MSGRKNKERRAEADQDLGIMNLGMAEQLGGNISHLKPVGVEIYLHHDRIEISFMEINSNLDIPFCNITNIENMTKDEFFSSLWPTYFLGFRLGNCIKIQYQENLEDLYVMTDFDLNLKFAPDFLNKKIQESKKGRQSLQNKL